MRISTLRMLLLASATTACVFVSIDAKRVFAESVSDSTAANVQTDGERNAIETVYVDGGAGADTNPGTRDSPFRTISRAIATAPPGARILVAAGTYDQRGGEAFPLQLKDGQHLLGEGEVTIVGSGRGFASATFGRQEITVVAPRRGAIENVTITNPDRRGHGLWLESSQAEVKRCRFLNSGLDGVTITGQSRGRVIESYFSGNRANGVTVAASAEPTLENNTIVANGTGVTVAGQSRPHLINNRITDNLDGVIVESEALPKVRQSVIRQNRRNGLVAVNGGQADLGAQGENIVEANGFKDVQFLSRAVQPFPEATSEPPAPAPAPAPAPRPNANLRAEATPPVLPPPPSAAVTELDLSSAVIRRIRGIQAAEQCADGLSAPLRQELAALARSLKTEPQQLTRVLVEQFLEQVRSRRLLPTETIPRR